MSVMFRSAILVSILFALVGCAGRNFVRPTPETFTLGKTTYPQVIERMGEPGTTGSLLKNGQSVSTISYVYVAGGEPLEKGVIPGRVQVYYFHNSILVGQEFLSSFKSDNSNFDDTKISEIVKGRTTRAEVIQLLGRPSASFIPPMVKESSGEAVGYTYQAIRRGTFSGLKVSRKALQISFDDQGVVSNVDYMTSSNK